MVAWSTRCSSCRQRKIKCDRQWPACGQCQKAKQQCSGPPDKVKFVAENSAEGSSQAVVINRFRSRPSSQVPPRKQPIIPPSVPSSQPTLVGGELVSLLTSQAKTFGFSSFAHVLQHVPAMLDGSQALTSAVSCLADARRRQSMSPKPDRKLDLRLYCSALRNLRFSLQDENELSRIETLLATLIMWRVEATIATTVELPYLLVTWSVHLAGAAYLLERLGPEAANNKLVFSVILESLSELSSHYYARNQWFFMGSPKWQRIFNENRDVSIADKLLFKVYSQMSVFPDVMRDLRRYHLGQVSYDHIHSRIISMHVVFDTIEGPIRTILEDQSVIGKRAACSPTSPVEEVYDTEDSEIPRACCLYALAKIVANNMISALNGSLYKFDEENYLHSRRIWMFHEQAMKVGSFGMHYYPTAILLTYGSAKSRETEEWIVDLLNLLQERNPATDIMWTREEIFQRCYATSGNIWPSLPPEQNLLPTGPSEHANC
ncbi:uncharacterized protein GGS22DRAFT_127711 [Annulohypoxylon maeteangense]|uniref:uncharacterized protein n=1 Tax=Annulohypoxylon maeteangense TaxID=1927788 RepID=UPI002007F9A3|nr:uncharacterized protein GGS22DRAFT_127711 [Annulohypoxylon maeteangense]KAI0886341.1 hypothetical protein GGS22DRAFT_127711 [Annulohypoxylon maeteangense]